MKPLAVVAALLLCCTLSYSQSAENPISRFSLSVNPLGFVQFGPVVSAEVGLTSNLVLNAHVRFPSLGLLSYVVADDEDGLDSYSGSAFGAGLLYFFGDRKNKPYVGGLFNYQSTDLLYGQGKSYEWWEKDKTVVFMANGGYRFRFASGFFINTGAYLGVANTSWDWNYKNLAYGLTDKESRTGSDITPFGMLEFTLGYEFK